jgi:hypothetical protein
MPTARLTEAMTLSQRLSHEEKLRLIEYVAQDLQRTSPPTLIVARGPWVRQGGVGKRGC